MLAGLLAGCARPVGDLGRAEPDALHDGLLPAAGALRARAAGEPVSAFNRTDEEAEMADRLWRFEVSGHLGDGTFDRNAELQRTRTSAPPGGGFGVDRYYGWLHGTQFASAATRYAALGEDIAADLATLPAAFASICKVETIDRQRRIAADGLPMTDRAVEADRVARRLENDRMIATFTAALGYRYQSYSYALDHLLIETPYPAARGIDDALAALAGTVEAARRGDFCADARRHPGRTAAPGAAIPSRFLHGNPPARPGPATGS